MFATAIILKAKLCDYLVIWVNLGSRSNAKNECDKNCAPNHGKARSGGVSLSLCICMNIHICKLTHAHHFGDFKMIVK